MSLTLAIDTSHVVTAGLARDGRPLCRETVEDTRAHAEALMPTVLAACARAGVSLAEVDEYVVGMGPGPFTGLRVGIATAWSLAHAAGRPVHGVCSLDIIARQWTDTGQAPEQFVVVADARRKELYWATYRGDGTRINGPQVTAPDQVPSLPAAGTAPMGRDTGLTGPDRIDPAVLAARWRALAPAGAEPYYLRPADATVPGPPKSALPRLRAAR